MLPHPSLGSLGISPCGRQALLVAGRCTGVPPRPGTETSPQPGLAATSPSTQRGAEHRFPTVPAGWNGRQLGQGERGDPSLPTAGRGAVCRASGLQPPSALRFHLCRRLVLDAGARELCEFSQQDCLAKARSDLHYKKPQTNETMGRCVLRG